MIEEFVKWRAADIFDGHIELSVRTDASETGAFF